MSAVIGKKGISVQEYLDWEVEQPEKHEYINGEVFAMVGATRKHNTIGLNIASFLTQRLHGTPRRAFHADMKLQVEAAHAYYYPDVMVTCDEHDLRAELVMISPTVIIEVLSPSTAADDRGNKFAAYRQIASLREYFLVDPDTKRIDGFRRADDGAWMVVELAAQAPLAFTSLNLEIGWTEIFSGAD